MALFFIIKQNLAVVNMLNYITISAIIIKLFLKWPHALWHLNY